MVELPPLLILQLLYSHKFIEAFYYPYPRAGNFQGVETPRPLVSAQKGAQKTKKHLKTPGYRAEQEQVRRKHDGGGQEARDWRHDPPRDRQGPGRRLRLAGGGG